MDAVALTAQWTAAERARETLRPDRLFADPWAQTLAGAYNQGVYNEQMAQHLRSHKTPDQMLTDLYVAAGNDPRCDRKPSHETHREIGA